MILRRWYSHRAAFASTTRRSQGWPPSTFEVDEAPVEGLSEYYQKISGLSESTLWLNADETFLADIVREYDSMKEYSLNEAEHSTYAIENLLKREIGMLECRRTGAGWPRG
jgi:hypothetical protein